MQPVPAGVAGELCTGGAGLARGYLRSPELDAEKFVPNPFSNEPGAKLYKTGDRARYLADGTIEFLGRMDLQIKIRGFRLEIGEIESVLGSHPAVKDCAVISRADQAGEKQLVAYIVARANAEATVQDLRSFLAQKLPDYMIPSAFSLLDALPLTSNGKVDRNALPSPEINGNVALGEASLPTNRLELELIRIWQRLFQREDIGRQDNFFALGGNSLSAVRLTAEIDKLLGCKLPIATLFQSPTIELLARRLSEQNWAPKWSSLVPLQPEGSKPPLFLVHGVGGDVYVFLRLAKLLGADQPIHGIQAVGFDGKRAWHNTLEAMAAHYAQEIRSFQPDGPYYLGGYSLGGVIAYEVAQQLQRDGQRVAFLGLIDSMPDGVIPPIMYLGGLASYLPRRVLFHLRSLWNTPGPERLHYVRDRWAALRFWINRNSAKPLVVKEPSNGSNVAPEVAGYNDYFHGVSSAYRFREYQGSADVFRCEDMGPSGMSSWTQFIGDDSWKKLIRGGVAFHRIPGSHLEILTSDYLFALAKPLSAALHRAQAGG